MQINVFSDKHINSDERTQNWVKATVEVTLERHLEDLTRVEVHLSDENGGKSGPKDKRCKMEARPKGHQPISVSHDADELTLAVEGFEEKEPKQSADDLLEEEFLEKEKELDKIS